MNAEPTIVYLVTKGEYSDYRVVGVFSTKEKAQERIDLDKPDNYHAIEEFMLDNNCLLPGHYKVCRVRMMRDGTAVEAHCDPSVEYMYEDRFISTDRAERWFGMCARDVTHAIKIANERRTKMIAENQW